MGTRLTLLAASAVIAALLVVVATVALGAEPVGNKADGATKAATALRASA